MRQIREKDGHDGLEGAIANQMQPPERPEDAIDGNGQRRPKGPLLLVSVAFMRSLHEVQRIPPRQFGCQSRCVDASAVQVLEEERR